MSFMQNPRTIAPYILSLGQSGSRVQIVNRHLSIFNNAFTRGIFRGGPACSKRLIGLLSTDTYR